MSVRRVALALVLAAITIASAPGCRAAARLTSLWPEAASERTFAQPTGPARWPLTGLDAADPASVQRRVISVKIENSPAARPQSGLDQADVIYETVTEGGITRFNALFQSRIPKEVGPVRSARPSDLYILPQYKALFAHCGGEPDVMKALKDPSYGDMDQFFHPNVYYRDRSRSAPHNLFVRLADLQAEAAKRGFAATEAIRPFAFDRSSVAATVAIKSIMVPFAPDNKVTWRFDRHARTYLRSINGKPHKDRVSGRQYSARNVVVLWAQVRQLAHRDVLGTPTVEIKLSGEGRAAVFRGGQRFDGTWKASDAPPTFTAADGRPIRLAPGNTWFQVVANDRNITTK